ncbi:MAG: hypothetical protein ACKO1T_11165 [Sediminibacterium sp.]
MTWIDDIIKDIRHLFFLKQNIIRQPLQKIELVVEVSFETFVQVCFTDATGKYRIKEFTGKNWSTELLLFDEREIMFSVFVNNHLLKKDQYIILTKKINDEISARQKIELSNTQLYEGWFRLNDRRID